MLTTDLKDLIQTVELLREELHPELDAGFLEAVVRSEEESPRTIPKHFVLSRLL